MDVSLCYGSKMTNISKTNCKAMQFRFHLNIKKRNTDRYDALCDLFVQKRKLCYKIECFSSLAEVKRLIFKTINQMRFI